MDAAGRVLQFHQTRRVEPRVWIILITLIKQNVVQPGACLRVHVSVFTFRIIFSKRGRVRDFVIYMRITCARLPVVCVCVFKKLRAILI